MALFICPTAFLQEHVLCCPDDYVQNVPEQLSTRRLSRKPYTSVVVLYSNANSRVRQCLRDAYSTRVR